MGVKARIQKINKYAFLMLCGIIIFFILLEGALRSGGSILVVLHEYKNFKTLERKNSYRILCLGESTTYFGGEYSYPSQLERILNEKDLGMEFSVINKGGIINTSVIVDELEKYIEKYKPDMIITMMGINDGGDLVVYNKEHPIQSMRVYKLIKLIIKHFRSRTDVLHASFSAIGPKIKMDRKRKIEVMIENNEIDKAIKALEDILQNDKDKKYVYYLLGHCHRTKENYSTAMKYLKIAYNLEPDNRSAINDLGRCYEMTNQYEKAKVLYEESFRLYPIGLEENINLGNFYNLTGKYQEAIKYFDKVVSLKADHSSVYMGLWESYTGLNNIVKAKEMLKKNIEINPIDTGAFIELAWIYIRETNYGEAEKIIRYAIEKNPEIDRMYGYMAYIYDLMGEKKLAKKYFDHANQIRLQIFNPITKKTMKG